MVWQIVNRIMNLKSNTDKDLCDVIRDRLSNALLPTASEDSIQEFLDSFKSRAFHVDEILGVVNFLREWHDPLIQTQESTLWLGQSGSQFKNLPCVLPAVLFILASAGVSCIADCGSDWALPSPQGTLENLGFAFIQLNDFFPRYDRLLRFWQTSRDSKCIFDLAKLTLNPSNAKRYMLGTFDKHHLLTLTKVMQSLEMQQGILVSSLDGIDGFTPSSDSHVVQQINNEIHQFIFDPRNFEIPVALWQNLKLPTHDRIEDRIHTALSESHDDLDQMIQMQASWAFVASGKATSFKEGNEMVLESILSKRALQKYLEFQHWKISSILV